MMNKKLFYFTSFLVLILLIASCTTNVDMAKLNIYFEPNPVLYNSIDEEWNYTITIEEINGIPVNLTSLEILSYKFLAFCS